MLKFFLVAFGRLSFFTLLTTGAAIAVAQSATQSAAQPAIKAVEKQATPVAEPVQAKLVRRKVVLVGAKETFQDAATAKPGETLEETVTYTNKSKKVLTAFVATLPIPLNTELVPNSTRPVSAAVLASTDGTNFRALPLKRKVKQANGVELEQPVPLSEYRFLRWNTSELPAGKSLVYSARFKVADDAASLSTPTLSDAKR